MRPRILILLCILWSQLADAQAYYKRLYRLDSAQTQGTVFYSLRIVDSLCYLNGQSVNVFPGNQIRNSGTTLTVNLNTTEVVRVHRQSSLDTVRVYGENSLAIINDTTNVSGGVLMTNGAGFLGGAFINYINHANGLYQSVVVNPLDSNFYYGGHTGRMLTHNMLSDRIGFLVYQVKDLVFYPDSTVLYILNNQGNILHRRAFGNVNSSYAHRPAFVQSASDGGFYVGINKPFRMYKTDSTGVVEWSYQYNANPQPYINAMTETADGGYMVAGRSDMDSIYGYNSLGDPMYAEKCFTLKINSNRQLEWIQKTGAWVVTDVVRGIFDLLPLDNGNVVSIGEGDTTSIYGGNFARLDQFDLNGHSIWERYYNIYEPEYIAVTALSVDTVSAAYGGGFVLAGHFWLNDNTHPMNGDWGWLIRTDSFGCLVPGCELYDAVSLLPETKPLLRLYPNPVVAGADAVVYLQIVGAPQAEAQLTLTDIQGRVLRSRAVEIDPQVQMIIPLDGLEAGIYFISLHTPHGIVTEKVLIGR